MLMHHGALPGLAGSVALVTARITASAPPPLGCSPGAASQWCSCILGSETIPTMRPPPPREAGAAQSADRIMENIWETAERPTRSNAISPMHLRADAPRGGRSKASVASAGDQWPGGGW